MRPCFRFMLGVTLLVSGCAHTPPAWYQPTLKPAPAADGKIQVFGTSNMRSTRLAESAAAARARSIAMQFLRCYRVVGDVVQTERRGETLYVQWSGQCSNFDLLDAPTGRPKWVGEYRRGKRGPDGAMWTVAKVPQEDPTAQEGNTTLGAQQAKSRIKGALGCKKLVGDVREVHRGDGVLFVLYAGRCAEAPVTQPADEDAPPGP